MTKRLPVLAMAMALIGGAGASTILRAQQTWTGMVSDSTCGGDHGGEVDVRECTQKCIKNGDKYVLAVDNGVKVIPITNQDFAALPQYAGIIVKVTGELKSGGIVISKIEEPRPVMAWILLVLSLFAQRGAPPATPPSTASAAAPASAPALDYEFFKTRVQPIFLKKRPGNARCIVCHETGTPRLQSLTPGATTWDEEQSQKNFAAWQRVVVPGKPLASRMLLHPLAAEAGGDAFHAGGKHWTSQSDPEWQTLAAWVNGAK